MNIDYNFWNTIADFTLVVLVTFAAFLPFIGQMKRGGPDKWYNRLTVLGKAFVVLSILTVFVALLKTFFLTHQNVEQTKKEALTEQKAALKEQLDSITRSQVGYLYVNTDSQNIILDSLDSSVDDAIKKVQHSITALNNINKKLKNITTTASVTINSEKPFPLIKGLSFNKEGINYRVHFSLDNSGIRNTGNCKIKALMFLVYPLNRKIDKLWLLDEEDFFIPAKTKTNNIDIVFDSAILNFSPYEIRNKEIALYVIVKLNCEDAFVQLPEVTEAFAYDKGVFDTTKFSNSSFAKKIALDLIKKNEIDF